jgi:hypothetical protein
MGESLLNEAARKGIPLADFTIRFIEGIDYAAATESLNSLGEDFHLRPWDWYNNPQLRVGQATKEALERLFGWRIKRVPLERYDEDSKTWGHWPDTYRWGEETPPTRHPVTGVIEEIGLSQPGADDVGQWYE